MRWTDLELVPEAETVKLKCACKSASLRKMSCLLPPSSSDALSPSSGCKSEEEVQPGENEGGADRGIKVCVH